MAELGDASKLPDEELLKPCHRVYVLQSLTLEKECNCISDRGFLLLLIYMES